MYISLMRRKKKIAEKEKPEIESEEESDNDVNDDDTIETDAFKPTEAIQFLESLDKHLILR